jgi:hypothetical protein
VKVEALHGGYDYGWGREAGSLLLAQPRRPDGVFCGNDLIAAGIIDLWAEHGLHAPDDFRIIGCDNTPFAAWPAYDLTSFDQRSDDMASFAIDACRTDAAPLKRMIVPTALVRRSGSVANSDVSRLGLGLVRSVVMDDFKGRHFTGEVILWAVRWYCRYGISYRDLEEMLAERGIDVDHTTIYRWVQRYAPEMEKRLRWFGGEALIRAGVWMRPTSRFGANGPTCTGGRQKGDTIDFFLSSTRSAKAAKRWERPFAG